MARCGSAAHRSARRPTQAPVFSTDITDQSNTEGDVVSLDADATDADLGDTLTYSATNLPDGITINASTGVVSGTLSATSSGSYNVVITRQRRHRSPTPTRSPGRSPTPVAPNTALDFDGTNDHVTLRRRPRPSRATRFTIETWFRRDGTGVAAQHRQRRRR